jgi:hypothetical protein
MRSLSGTLSAAQQGTAFRPAVRLQLRPQSGMADRYALAQVATLTTLPANAVTAPVAIGGVLYVYALNSSSGAISVRTVSAAGVEGAATALGTAVGAPSLLAACPLSGGGAALATGLGGSLSQPARLYQLSTPTSTLPAPTAIDQIGAGQVQTALGLAQAGDGRIGVGALTHDGSASYFGMLIQTSAGGAFPASANRNPNTSTGAFNGLGLVYSGDWLLATAGSWDAGASEIGLVICGDGGQLAAGSWNSAQILMAVNLATAGGVGTALSVGGAVAGDVVRLLLSASFQNNAVGASDYSFNRGYQIAVPDGRAWSMSVGREPQALPSMSSTPPQPAFDAGNAALWTLTNTAVCYSAAPQTSDYSARVLRLDRQEAEHGGVVRALLDNSDGALTVLALSPETVGQRLTADFGYSTSAGAELSGFPPTWVSSATCLWDGDRRTVELVAHDGTALLAAWRPRRSYTWLTGVATIGGIIAWICGKAGLAYTPPSTLSTQAQTTPAYIVRGGTDGLRAVMDLLARVPECLKLTSSGATLVQPLEGASAVYSYGAGGLHPIVTARATVHGQGVNHVVVMGSAESAIYPSALAEAIDAADQYREGPQAEVERDMQLTGGTVAARLASAQLRAAAVLAKAQLLQDAGEIVAAPNVGLEIWDRIAVTCPALGWNATGFCVREIRTLYEVDRNHDGVYTQSIGLMPVGTGMRQ